jgi:PAS domain S-box-containing protein
MAYSLAFATSEGNIFPPLTREPTEAMQRQLSHSQDQLRYKSSSSNGIAVEAQDNLIGEEEAPLPKTFEDAVSREQHRAIVVTEARAPFRVVDVNKEWEGLCGYSYVESKGKTLGELLRGPETNTSSATALVNKLMQGEEAGVVLTNYTKSGRKFINRLRAGPLIDTDSGEVTHFVGVLQEQKM